MKSIARQLKRRAIVASRAKLAKLDREVSAGYCAVRIGPRPVAFI